MLCYRAQPICHATAIFRSVQQGTAYMFCYRAHSTGCATAIFRGVQLVKFWANTVPYSASQLTGKLIPAHKKPTYRTKQWNRPEVI